MIPARCNHCGREWPRDPALEVPCPKCDAKVGHYCIVRRPSGHTANFGDKTLVHPHRDQAAMDAGFLKPCPVAAPQAVPELQRQQSLFGGVM